MKVLKEVRFFMIVSNGESIEDHWMEKLDTSVMDVECPDKQNNDAIAQAKEVVQFFNDTLKDGEKPRKLEGVKKIVTLSETIL